VDNSIFDSEREKLITRTADKNVAENGWTLGREEQLP
jgi:hypothetical protein